MALKLKACDICGAVTSKDDEGFHLRWHAEAERSRAIEFAAEDWAVGAARRLDFLTPTERELYRVVRSPK